MTTLQPYKEKVSYVKMSDFRVENGLLINPKGKSYDLIRPITKEKEHKLRQRFDFLFCKAKTKNELTNGTLLLLDHVIADHKPTEKLEYKSISKITAFDRGETNENRIKDIEKGEFYLPWNYVRFMNGYMFLYHPMYPEGLSNHPPLRHDDKNSRKALNDIKGYIIKKLQPIRVTAKNNRIVAVHDINQISEAVEYLHMTTTDAQVKLLRKEKQQAKSNSIHDQDSNEVLEKLKLYKSKYLEHLSDINLVNHKVFYALEVRVNSSETSTTEVAFIFTLKQDQEHTLIIYENNLPARVSVCFVVKTERYNEAIDVINNFFSSDTINKREMLMSGSVEFDKTCIEKYFRVNHDDFNLWKLFIKEI